MNIFVLVCSTILALSIRGTPLGAKVKLVPSPGPAGIAAGCGPFHPVVEARGFEPRTPCLQSTCSTAELCPPVLQASWSWGPARVSPGVVVRLLGLEPSTSRLSGGCSNQLSYKRVRASTHRQALSSACDGCLPKIATAHRDILAWRGRSRDIAATTQLSISHDPRGPCVFVLHQDGGGRSP